VEFICCVVDGTPLPIIHTHNGDGTFQNTQEYLQFIQLPAPAELNRHLGFGMFLDDCGLLVRSVEPLLSVYMALDGTSALVF